MAWWLNTWEQKKGDSRELQDSEGYIRRPCLKKKEEKNDEEHEEKHTLKHGYA